MSGVSTKTGKVGLLTALCLIIGNTVGSGIFTTSGFLARDIGHPWIILAIWLIASFVVLCGTRVYLAMHRRWPESGGEFTYVRNSFGALPGFLCGWTSFSVGFGAAIAASAMGFAYYFQAGIGHITGNTSAIPTNSIALLTIVFVSVLHGFNTRLGSRFHNSITLAKLAIIFFILIFAFLSDRSPGQSDMAESTATLSFFQSHTNLNQVSFISCCVGMIYIFYAFSGWNAATYISEELIQSNRTLWLAMLIGVGLIVILYLFANTVYFSALSLKEITTAPVLPIAEKAVSAKLGSAAAALFSLVLSLSFFTSISAMIWVGPRVYAKMAEHQLAPRFISDVNQQGIPVFAISVQALWASILCLCGKFEELILYGGMAIIFFSGLAVVGFLKSERHSIKPMLVERLCAMIYLGVSYFILLLSVLNEPLVALASLLTILVGLPLYWLGHNKKLCNT